MKAIHMEDIRKKYRIGKVDCEALRGITLQIDAGEIVCVMGPSGSGKTTLLNIIGCIDNYDSGNLSVMETDMARATDAYLSEFRNKTLGFIFQSFNLIPVLNAFENVEYPLILRKMPKPKRKKAVEEIMEAVGLSGFMRNKPDELSGGQRQRVAIARSLVTNPRIVIADEPTSSLDHGTGTEIMELVKKMNEVHGTTFIFSTHDGLVSKYASRIVKIMDGLLVE